MRLKNVISLILDKLVTWMDVDGRDQSPVKKWRRFFMSKFVRKSIML